MITISLIITILIIIICLIIIIKNRRNITSISLCSLGGIIIADIIMLFPMIQMGLLEDKNPLLALFYTFQICSMNADYSMFIEASQKISFTLFRFVFIFMNIISPIAFAGVLISLFKDAVSVLTYSLLSNFSDIYYLSDLNDNSLLLAEDIKKHESKSLIVFCSSNYATDEQKSYAYKMGAVLFNKKENELIKKTKHKQYYFEISNNQDENLINALELIETLKASKKIKSFENRKIFIYSEKVEAGLSLSSIDKKGISVILVNRWRMTAYNLLFNHPIYESLNNDNPENQILIVGAGAIGNQVLKACVWATRLDNYNIKIKIIDKASDLIKKQLLLESPELLNDEYALDFITADVTSVDFENALKANCSAATYIVVALGNDSLNIQTALYLRSFYLRQDSNFINEPKIYVQINSNIKSLVTANLTAIEREKINRKDWSLDSKNAQNYNLIPFGTATECYSYDFIINPPIEKISINAHSAYEQIFSEQTPTKEQLLEGYNLNEINKNSNRANAIHLLYKLFLLGYKIKPFENATQEEISKSKILVEELSQKLNDEKILQKMSYIEHERWMAYMRGEGYISATIEQANIYKQTAGSHKYIRAKMNACICSWEDLDNVCQAFDSKIKDYDKIFIQNMIYILGLKENKNINITNIKNILIEK